MKIISQLRNHNSHPILAPTKSINSRSESRYTILIAAYISNVARALALPHFPSPPFYQAMKSSDKPFWFPATFTLFTPRVYIPQAPPRPPSISEVSNHVYAYYTCAHASANAWRTRIHIHALTERLTHSRRGHKREHGFGRHIDCVKCRGSPLTVRRQPRRLRHRAVSCGVMAKHASSWVRPPKSISLIRSIVYMCICVYVCVYVCAHIFGGACQVHVDARLRIHRMRVLWQENNLDRDHIGSFPERGGVS